MIDCDNGTESARKVKDQFSADRSQVDVLQSFEPQPTADAVQYRKAKDLVIGIANLCHEKKYPFPCLIIDSFTTVCDGALRYVLKNNGRLVRPLTTQNGNITQPEWGLMINEVEQFVQIVKGLPIHVIVLAHTVPENINGLIRQEISIPTQKLPPRIPNYFDEIWYLQDIEEGGGVVNKVLRTVECPQYLAKSRAGLPDKTPVNTGMMKIFEMLGRKL